MSEKKVRKHADRIHMDQDKDRPLWTRQLNSASINEYDLLISLVTISFSIMTPSYGLTSQHPFPEENTAWECSWPPTFTNVEVKNDARTPEVCFCCQLWGPSEQSFISFSCAFANFVMSATCISVLLIYIYMQSNKIHEVILMCEFIQHLR